MRLGFRADVDTLGWLIQNQDTWIYRQPSRQRNFLLVSARESSCCREDGRGLDAQIVNIKPGQIEFFFSIDQAPPRYRFKIGHTDVRCNRHLKYNPVLSTILRQVSYP